MDIDGSPLRVSGNTWIPGQEQPSNWYGCGDLDGDLEPSLSVGTYVIDNDAVRWEGRELTIEGDTVTGFAAVSGVIENYERQSIWPDIARPCPQTAR